MVLQAMLTTADVLLLRLTAVPLLNRLPLASLRKLLLRFELALEGPRSAPATSLTQAVEAAAQLQADSPLKPAFMKLLEREMQEDKAANPGD